MSTDRKILIVVPAWNEEQSISTVVEGLIAAGYEVLVIDDGSTDRTPLVARSAGAIVLRLPFNLGVGAALRAGFRFAVQNGFDTVVQCDADGQHPAEYISHLINALDVGGFHMVIGSRFLGQSELMELSRIRRFAMAILRRSATKAARTSITDATSGFRAICSPLLEEFSMKLPPYYLGDTYEALVSAGRAGYRIAEIPAPLRPREFGQSSANPLKASVLVVKALLSVVMSIHQRIAPPEQNPST